MHKRILLRAKKAPWDVVSAEVTHDQDMIGNNSGNLVFSHAAWKILDTGRTDLTPTRNPPNVWDAGELNERYDVFVIPLANAFRRSWQEPLLNLTRLVERLKIPVVVFGVGAQTAVDGDRDYMRPIDDVVKRFVRAVLDRSATIGVRGEVTEGYLRDLGFKDVEVIGCPSMFLHGADFRVDKGKPELAPTDRVAINVSPYVKAMGKIVTAHHERYPNLRYIPQDIKTLGTLLWGDLPGDQGKHSAIPLHTSHPLFAEDKVRFFIDPWSWMSYLSGCDFAFGTRIHGNITALVSGTPCYLFAHDSRTRELAEYFGIPHRVMANVPADVDAARLYEEADFTALNQGHRERFTRMVDFLRRNDLENTFTDGDGGQQFEARVAEQRFPAAVRPLAHTAPAEIADRMNWLRNSRDEFRERATALERKTLPILAQRAGRKAQRLFIR